MFAVFSACLVRLTVKVVISPRWFHKRLVHGVCIGSHGSRTSSVLAGFVTRVQDAFDFVAMYVGRENISFKSL